LKQNKAEKFGLENILRKMNYILWYYQILGQPKCMLLRIHKAILTAHILTGNH